MKTWRHVRCLFGLHVWYRPRLGEPYRCRFCGMFAGKPWIGAVLLLLLAAPAAAGPITLTVDYVAGPSTVVGVASAPDFAFTLAFPDYVTTSGMFDLADPVTFATGVDPAWQSVTQAGTNRLGWWIFGAPGAADMSDRQAGCEYQIGACFAFVPDGAGGYLVAPGTVSGASWGQTRWSWDTSTVARLDGRITLTVSEAPVLRRSLALVAVPDSGSTGLLLGLGAGLMVGLRKRSN